MNPTEKNKMPKYFIEAIQKTSELKQIWPVIRSHGYAGAYRWLRNIESTVKPNESNSRVETARKVRLIDRALEIFEAAIADVEDNKNS